MAESRSLIERSIACCGVSYGGGALPPAMCPNCGRPWGGSPPVEHREAGGTQHELGYVAWCSCGVGTPPKASVETARRSLAEHIVNPSEFPR